MARSQSLDQLREFHRFVGEKVLQGEGAMSPEEVLDEWRIFHPEPQSLQEDVEAIEEAIRDLEAGDNGIPFEEFDRDFRARHNLPPAS